MAPYLHLLLVSPLLLFSFSRTGHLMAVSSSYPFVYLTLGNQHVTPPNTVNQELRLNQFTLFCNIFHYLIKLPEHMSAAHAAPPRMLPWAAAHTAHMKNCPRSRGKAHSPLSRFPSGELSSSDILLCFNEPARLQLV